MTYESHTFANINRNSFVENTDKRNDRHDYTGDSENVSPPIIQRLIDRGFYGMVQNVGNNTIIQTQTLIRGLEDPVERSDLYDHFDIYHEALSKDNE